MNKSHDMQQTKYGRKILLFPLPLQGHINPMIQLANILHSKGFSIVIIHTSFNSLDSSNYRHFTFHSIPDRLSEDEASTEDVIALLSILNVRCVEALRNCLAKLVLDECLGCLITDVMWYFARGVAEQFKIPTIGLRTTNVCSFLGFAAFPLLRDLGYLSIHGRLDEAVQELPPLRVKDIPTIQTKDPDTLYNLIDKVMNQTKEFSGLIWNSCEELEQHSFQKLKKDFPIQMYPIGPFHKHFQALSTSLLPQDQTCISWLDTKPPNSVLYVSFGSIAAITKAEFHEIAWGLANSNHPFLWVVRPGLVGGSGWFEPLPDGFMEMVGERGCIVKWAPQQEVLGHPAIGGFWTHNGWNSTLESICEGVPMICMPNFGDQMVNARYVSDVWGVGIHLEGKIKREDVKIAIKRLLEEEEGKDLKKRVLHLKEKLDLCSREGGSSYCYLENLINYILSL
ncbi:UDP-glycosyltransferase 76B1-like isoform X2 [Euphorbia lathyris]|uniref:UDP-glycosyltransferase 76B1-like isoform X2 n=1 Tax=Euphorbia lathyris TaxID=212925 RepID=UPI00331433D9